LIFLLSQISGSTTTSTPTHISLPKSQITYNELSIEKEIGKGSYGKVCVGEWNGTRVAIKFCRNKTKLTEFMHEVRLIMYVCVNVNVNEFDFRISHTQMNRERL
jgi:predicted Ser/Thr protein kinase